MPMTLALSPGSAAVVTLLRPTKNVKSMLLMSSLALFFAVMLKAAPSKASSIQTPFCVTIGTLPKAIGKSIALVLPVHPWRIAPTSPSKKSVSILKSSWWTNLCSTPPAIW